VRFILAFKVILFSVLVPGAVTLYFPYSLLSRSDGNLQAASLVLAIPACACLLVGTAIYLRCAWDFAIDGLGTPAPIDPPKKLVVTGLYRWIRNPMYQGVLLILLGECVLFPDRGLLVYTASFALVFHVFVVFYEEPILRSRFGVSYSDYCRKVPRWNFAFRSFTMDSAKF
jgi:protein-S-isoprenylcysteine O-methyltransferase Ste14